MQDCGGCREWIKCKPEGYGVCELLDCRCNSDNGHTCKFFKRPKNKRKKEKKDE